MSEEMDEETREEPKMRVLYRLFQNVARFLCMYNKNRALKHVHD